MPLLPQNGTLGIQRAAHLLRRATFGANKAQIDYFAGLSPAQAVTQLFGMNLPASPAPIDPESGLPWVTGPVDPDENYLEQFVGWYLGRILGSGNAASTTLGESAREKVVFFMHSFFTTMKEKVRSGHALYYQNELFRTFALDAQDSPLGPRDFRTLVKKISLDNAMIRFLDGSRNVKGSPNENYAREMLELYTIGRGLEGSNPPAAEQGDDIHYTEQDVRAAANVLTGYDYDETFSNIDPETNLPTCVLRGGATGTAHETDDSLKVFSNRFNNQQIAQNISLMIGSEPSRESMVDELDQLVTMIFGQRETAMHICRKLYRYYVHYDVTEALNNDIINAMADIFVANGFRIQPVIEALLTSTHFYEALGGVEDDAFGGIIKSPVELIAGAMTLLEIQIPNQTTQAAEFNTMAGDILRLIQRQGMELYQPSEVAGYPAYHQFPKFNRNWITTNYLVQRYDFVRTLLDSNMGYWNIRSFVSQRFGGAAGDARQLILAMAPYFYPLANNLDFNANTGSITGDRLSYFLYAFLTANQYDEAEWTALYANAGVNYLEVETLLKSLFNAMLQTPEYQLH